MSRSQSTGHLTNVGTGAFDFDSGSITSLQPGQRIIVVEDISAFQFRYGANLPVAGQWEGRLSNDREWITLTGFDEILTQFQYRDDWYRQADGEGASLEVVGLARDNLSQPTSWRPSREFGGTPGRAAVEHTVQKTSSDQIDQFFARRVRRSQWI